MLSFVFFLLYFCKGMKIDLRGEWGGDSEERGLQELLLRTHGPNQGGGWGWGREGLRLGWGGGMGRKGTQL